MSSSLSGEAFSVSSSSSDYSFLFGVSKFTFGLLEQFLAVKNILLIPSISHPKISDATNGILNKCLYEWINITYAHVHGCNLQEAYVLWNQSFPRLYHA